MLGALSEGPARLSPDGVAASQRRRMLAAMVAAVADRGYGDVVVADVVGRARVSRATFYEHFADKGDCFLAAYHACVEDILDVLRRLVATDRPPRERLHDFFDSFTSHLMAFPEGARVCLVEMYAAGPEAAAQRRQIQLDFVSHFREIHTALGEAGEPVLPMRRFDFEAIVAAISSLATNRVAMGDAHELPRLRAPLEAFVLRQFGLDPS
jgi:AcrR family transcriptional regulator